uniref:Putative i-11 aae n=1 Tax=Culex tarsalis TaxID=7177 RepID=A0A1Q3G4W4_CULTA
MDGCMGFGVFHESRQFYFKLKDPCSVYVAELAAIYCALRLIENMPPDHYFIFTDSLSSVEAIRSLKPTRESAFFLTEIRKILNNLAAQSFSISVVWVRAHCSIQGNEKADLLAKKGAACDNIFERPISLQECYGFPRHRALRIWQTQWNNDTKGRWTCSIRPKVSRKAWFKGMDLTRGFIRTMSRLMSNHYSSKAQLYRINMSDTNLCDCGQGYQDIDHLVWACPDLHDHRTKLKDTLRARGRPPEIPIRDALSFMDLDTLYSIYQFIVDSKISI